MPKPLWIQFIQSIGFLLLYNTLWAQALSFRQFSVEQGLPGYSVISITQDKRGFMWLGTTEGLCRYDGIHFKTYKRSSENPSLISNNNILSLFTDSKGWVWAGTSGGLNRYNEKKDIFEQVLLNGKNMHVFCICEDVKGQIWAGGSGGLVRIDGGKTMPVNDYQNHNVKAIFKDSQGKIWIGSDKGVSVIETRNHKTVLTGLHTLLAKPLPPGLQNVTSIAEDAHHTIWIGTQNNGAYRFNPHSGSLTNSQGNSASNPGLINNNIRRIFLDKNKNLWIGTQEGISIINPSTGRFQNITHNSANKSSLSQNSVHSIFQDNNGSVWVGTYFGGVNLCYAYDTRFSTIQNDDNANSISNNVISRIVENKDGNLWIATEGGGLNFYNKATQTFRFYKHDSKNVASLSSNLIKELYLDKEDNLWLGTHGGDLDVLASGTATFTRYPINTNTSAAIEISSITEDRNRNLWIASNAGMYIFKKNGISLTAQLPVKFPLRSNPRYLYRDSDDDIWIAANAGLYFIQEGHFKELDSTSIINCFREEEPGIIWMGTNGSGLLKFNKKNKTLQRDNHPLLQSLNILGIIGDSDGSLWLSSSKGLIHYFPRNKNYQLYTIGDGIAGNEFNYNSFHKGRDGRFYFGGFNGITHFLPAEIKKNYFTAPLTFTALKQDNREVTINDAESILKENITSAQKLVFAYDQNVFTIEFALLNYIKSEKNKYQYKLEGFDKNWKETSEGSATYTNLPPGQYAFLVKGANNDGLWSRSISIMIHVKPPFWLTWWAYCIYALFIAALVFIIARFFFLREVLKKEDELHQAKLNFFTNASHEIRTHLTLIMAPVERLLSENKKERFIQQQLTQVKANTHRLLSLVSELMDFRKAETNHLHLHPRRQNLISFLQEIYESFREMSLSKNISMSLVHDEDFVEVNFDEQQLEKVFFNLLANAFKFTSEGGRIGLHISSRGSSNVVITVTDNGRGIAPQYLEKLFTNFFQVADHGLQNTGYGIGLALAKNIVELHKGSISVESIPSQNNNEGKTVFTVTLPKNAQLAAAPKIKPEPDSHSIPELVSLFVAPENKAENNILSGHKKYTLLIAEDNTELVQLIKETLAPLYNIITAENGRLGLEAAQSEIPDLIISDVMMPEMDGFALCEKIRQDERTCHIPVILLTAKSTQTDQVTGLQQGADLYLTKPFNIKVLELSVQNLLAARERMRQKMTKELVSLPVSSGETHSGKEILSNDLDKAFLEKVILIINKHIDNPEFGVDMLSRKVAMSAPVLYKKLRALTNMSVNEFIKLQRFKKAAELLAQKRLTVNEVSFAVGYDDRKYFSREFKKYFGVLPSEFSDSPKEFKS
ncbi:hybrid sensor histidine kinase/response regulator transcription factor [Niabella aquatica]